ncbi:MAG: hypothetical protein MJ200_04910 [Mycoplasmoidaceae bacterium]|nr:hypothetical protein [Mycoplasmoidaceae bacterium]
MSGSYKYKNKGEEEVVEVKDYHAHDIAYAYLFTETYYSQAYELYHDLILIIPNFAIFDAWSEQFAYQYSRIYFASHYLKGSGFSGN